MSASPAAASCDFLGGPRIVKTRVFPEWLTPPCGTWISACQTGSPLFREGRSKTSASYLSPVPPWSELWGIFTFNSKDSERDGERRLSFLATLDEADRERDLLCCFFFEGDGFLEAERALASGRFFDTDRFLDAERFFEAERALEADRFLAAGERLLECDRFLDAERFLD